MHFTYEEEIRRDELMQGDVLRRTPELNDVLKEVHPHFYGGDKNLYFMVLTQSCDLVPRDGSCKAPYIAIAPVRSVDLIVQKRVAEVSLDGIKSEVLLSPRKSRSKVDMFLNRLFNNNEASYFYLDSDGTELSGDCAAFLNLSIALKADLHFEKCLDAKFLQLTQAFQAKLGWLVGQLYSRVGTDDWPHKKVTAKVNSIVSDAAMWVDDGVVNPLAEKLRQICAEDPNRILSRQEIAAARRDIKTKKQQVMERVHEIIQETLGQGREDEVTRLAQRVRDDEQISSLLR